MLSEAAAAQYRLYIKGVPASTVYAGKIQADDWGLRRRRESAEVAPLDRPPLDRGLINRVVKWELKHIPRGDKGSPQNFLRFSYNVLRRKHMAQRKSRHETLKELIEKYSESTLISLPSTTKKPSKYSLQTARVSPS